MTSSRSKLVLVAVAISACVREASPVTAPSQEAAASPSPSPTPSAATQSEPGNAAPTTSAASGGPQRLPQSDPIPPPAPRCPSIGPLVQVSAVVKREAPGGSVLDIELTVVLPAKAAQATFIPDALTVYGGVLLPRPRKPADPLKVVALVRPSFTVAPEGSLRALFGLTCSVGQGNLQVDMTFALPPHDGDKVTIRSVTSY